jgi:hypothetical protein
MLKETKRYLFKNGKKILAVLFILIYLFFPFQKTKAGWASVDDVMAPLETSLEGEEEVAAPFAVTLLKIFLVYVFNLFLLTLSSNLLQYILNSRQWLVIQNSALVQAGWHFVAGLANLFLILIFVAIAIAYILKIETFQAKKALPKLIIVALLLNFSLVFVGILVDISNILYNTISKAGGTNFITDLVSGLLGGGWALVASLIAWIVALAVAFSIPITSPFAQTGFAIFMATLNLPTVITWIFQMIIFMMMSGIFLTYAFLFAARVFVIQILATLAPLAFICLILPQTEKYWREWLQHLLGWISLGLILLLFLVLGAKLNAAIAPPGILQASVFIPILGFWALFQVFNYYFFIFVFLILVIWLSKRTMPAMADFFINQVNIWSQRAWRRGAKPFVRATARAAEPLRKPLERVPIIGRALGGPGAYEAEQRKRVVAQKKVISDRPTEALRTIVANRREDPYRRAAAMEILAEKKKLTDAEKNYLGVAQSFKADMKAILQARPDWAPLTIDPTTRRPRTIKEIVEKMEPREFRRSIQAESFENISPHPVSGRPIRLEMFITTDPRQITELSTRGTRAQKEALRRLVRDHASDIVDEIIDLTRRGLREEADALFEKLQTVEQMI